MFRRGLGLGLGLKNECIFPLAIKPWQKAICGTTGLLVSGGLIYGSSCAYKHYILRPTRDSKREKREQRDVCVHKPQKSIFPSLDRFNEKYPISACMLGFGISGFSTISATTIIISQTRDCWKQIKETKQCCNIIRSTAKYSLTCPVFIFALYVSTYMSLTYLTDIRNANIYEYNSK